jgi:hypothetical protein
MYEDDGLQESVAKGAGWGKMDGRNRKDQNLRREKNKKTEKNQLDITIISLIGIYNKFINIL